MGTTFKTTIATDCFLYSVLIHKRKLDLRNLLTLMTATVVKEEVWYIHDYILHRDNSVYI